MKLTRKFKLTVVLVAGIIFVFGICINQILLQKEINSLVNNQMILQKEIGNVKQLSLKKQIVTPTPTPSVTPKVFHTTQKVGTESAK
jgi:hypothetical protein